MDSKQARSSMVEQQIRTWLVSDARILDLMENLPRERFVPPAYRSLAYADLSIPLGHGHVMEEPKIAARILQALNVDSLDNVLEVGTGSGYLTACLAQLGRQVRSIDIHEAFIRAAALPLTDCGLNNFELECRDLGRGLPGVEQHYDAIVVTGSLPAYHEGFHRALTIGGRLLLIIGTEPVMEAVLFTRVDVDQWVRRSLFETCLPPLENATQPPAFTF
ncbi:protein-L-isoaspartate O-methyltransferase family protein [Candidatus Macondimonas diazotrophica]|nr:protein-L-isoaspartate O-methyltransferase [Candidatus Macondimonas diazotrophica]